MDLNLFKLAGIGDDKDKNFFDRMDSRLIMNVNQNKILENDDWIDEVLFTLQYIEKALNNPNKNIITEEEIIKIELIKKVTIESVKHLAKNTQLITKYDKKNNEVTPEKILNAYKEENFVTYENRFIYTLIKLIDDFIFIRVRDSEENAYKGRDYIKAKYEASTRLGKKKISLKFDFLEENTAPHKKTNEAEVKIKEIKKSLKMFKLTEIYQLLESKHATLIKAPLKMTNVLLKNVNFQYAVKLWNYLSDNFDQKSLMENDDNKYEETGMTKTLVNEDFYFLHLIFQNALNGEHKKGKTKSAIDNKKDKEELIGTMIDKILQTSPEFTQDELQRIINERILKYKNVKITSLEPIENRFKQKIGAYLSMVEELRLK